MHICSIAHISKNKVKIEVNTLYIDNSLSQAKLTSQKPFLKTCNFMQHICTQHHYVKG